MNRNDTCYQNYVKILKEELRPAMGCTEPIAIAYAAAKARAVLGAVPERLLIEVSGNIIKNVKSVVVPPYRRTAGDPCRRCRGYRGRRRGRGAGGSVQGNAGADCSYACLPGADSH